MKKYFYTSLFLFLSLLVQAQITNATQLLYISTLSTTDLRYIMIEDGWELFQPNRSQTQHTIVEEYLFGMGDQLIVRGNYFSPSTGISLMDTKLYTDDKSLLEKLKKGIVNLGYKKNGRTYIDDNKRMVIIDESEKPYMIQVTY